MHVCNLLIFSDQLFEAIRFSLLPKRRSQSTMSKLLPRKATSSHHVLYAIGGMSRREATRSVERYDPKEGRWKAVGKWLKLFEHKI